MRPIADSNVELYVPASTKPVQVRNAHAKRLVYYFAMPLSVFALMAGIGGWLFFIVSRESDLPGHKPKPKASITTALQEQIPMISGEQYLRDAPHELPTPEKPTRASLNGTYSVPPTPETHLPALSPVKSPSEAQEACDLVRQLMVGDTLEKKLALTSDPEAVKSEFVRRYEANDAREIQPRTLRCEKQFERDDRVYLVVNATLFDFSKRDYIVQRGADYNRVVIEDPASLLP